MIDEVPRLPPDGAVGTMLMMLKSSKGLVDGSYVAVANGLIVSPLIVPSGLLLLTQAAAFAVGHGIGSVTRMSQVWPAEAFVEWDYADPDGCPHQVLNCSVADLALRVQQPGTDPVELTAEWQLDLPMRSCHG